jgi:hypothetical protein
MTSLDGGKIRQHPWNSSTSLPHLHGGQFTLDAIQKFDLQWLEHSDGAAPTSE